jgi:hypothetical protein
MAKQTFTTGQVLTAAQVNALQTNDFNQTVSAKTASYVLVAADKGTRIEFSTSGSVTCTVNTGLFDAGDTVYIQNTGAGVLTITAGTATVNTSASLTVNQYEGGVLYFVSASSAIWFEYASTATGDITGITTGATSGLTGGVTSGTADLKFNTTAKGGLLVGTGAGAVTELTVGSNNTVLTADSTTASGLKWAAASGGKVVQIVNATYGTRTSTTSATWQDSGLTASITPTSASNNVLVLANVNGVAHTSASNTTWTEVRLNIAAGARTLLIGGRVGLGVSTGGQTGAWGISTSYLDSPATTSSTTYKIQFQSSSAGQTAEIHYAGGTYSSITLLEVTP